MLETKVYDIDVRTRLILAIQTTIDLNKYEISAIYKDRVYLGSKQVAPFNIQQDDAACVTQGGYLLEIDNNEENKFTWDFAQRLGNTDYVATGANDIDQEGKFVFYHSKKPLPSNVTWLPNQPDDAGGNEDCMVHWIPRGGLNDIPCNLRVKYMCEIPLL